MDALKMTEYNPRRVRNHMLQSLRRSIERFGMVQPIVVNRRTKANGFAKEEQIVVGGHQRLRVAREMGWERVPVYWVSLKLNEEKILNLALNKIGGDFEVWQLAEMVKELQSQSAPLDAAGFTQKEIDDLIIRMEEETTEPEVPFAEELDEANNYVVLFFRTNTDWLQAVSVLGLRQVQVTRQDGTPWSKGIGRVVSGVEAIERIRRAALQQEG